MVSIILPTYNASEKLAALVRHIFEVTSRHNLQVEVIVVDDNSPDGTGELAYYLKRFFPKLKTLHRSQRLGPVSALLEGLEVAEGNIIGFLDANYSHPPALLPSLILPLVSGHIDITIASRYISGSRMQGWSLPRRLANRTAALLCRPLTPVKDPLSNFFCLRKTVLHRVKLDPSSPKLLLDLLVLAEYHTAQEIPFPFSATPKNLIKDLPSGRWIPFVRQLVRLYRYRASHARPVTSG